MHLLVPIVHVEEHDDVDDIPRARRLHQSAVWRLIEQICSYEVVLEAVFVAKCREMLETASEASLW